MCVLTQHLEQVQSHVIYKVLCETPLGEQVAGEDVEQGHGCAVEEQEICGQQRR